MDGRILPHNNGKNKNNYVQNKDFITIIGGNKYCLEFGIDGNGNVSNWYLNNWPEGDIIDYYDSLEQ